MSTGSVRKGSNWETDVRAFAVAIVLGRVLIDDISIKFWSRHKVTAKELVDYWSELNWASDLDFQVELAELMQVFFFTFSYPARNVVCNNTFM